MCALCGLCEHLCTGVGEEPAGVTRLALTNWHDAGSCPSSAWAARSALTPTAWPRSSLPADVPLIRIDVRGDLTPDA